MKYKILSQKNISCKGLRRKIKNSISLSIVLKTQKMKSSSNRIQEYFFLKCLLLVHIFISSIVINIALRHFTSSLNINFCCILSVITLKNIFFNCVYFHIFNFSLFSIHLTCRGSKLRIFIALSFGKTFKLVYLEWVSFYAFLLKTLVRNSFLFECTSKKFEV